MSFLKFLKDRCMFIVVYFLANIFSVLITYLSILINNKRIINWDIIYAFLVGMMLLIMFIMYDYIKANKFNKSLIKILESSNSIDEVLNIDAHGNSQQKLIKNTFLSIHREFYKRVTQYEKENIEQINFTANWVHQMKMPVSVINLIIEQQKNEDNKLIFDSLWEENEKISKGLDLMLCNTRFNDFSNDFNVEKISVSTIIRNVVNKNRKLFILNHIYPQINGRDELVESDGKWISFVLEQITVNAIKYTRSAEREKKQVIFNINNKADRVSISIKDNGIGIPKEDTGRIFNAFFTGKNGRNMNNSTGMGMYLSKKICDKLGHALYVKSKDREGTEFSIIFFKNKNIFNLTNVKD